MWACNCYRKTYNVIEKWKVAVTFKTETGDSVIFHCYFDADPTKAQIHEAVTAKLASLNGPQSLPAVSQKSPITLSIESDKETLKWDALNFFKDHPTCTLTEIKAGICKGWQQEVLLDRMVWEYAKQMTDQDIHPIDMAGTQEAIFTALRDFIVDTDYDKIVTILSET